jgi:hypothetical protein
MKLPIYHPNVARGGCSHAEIPAPNNRRYVGMFYWSAYWQSWDKVIAVDATTWTVQEVNLSGSPIGPVRNHSTPMDARHFAVEPFRVMSRYDSEAVAGYIEKD